MRMNRMSMSLALLLGCSLAACSDSSDELGDNAELLRRGQLADGGPRGPRGDVDDRDDDRDEDTDEARDGGRRRHHHDHEHDHGDGGRKKGHGPRLGKIGERFADGGCWAGERGPRGREDDESDEDDAQDEGDEASRGPRGLGGDHEGKGPKPPLTLDAGTP